MINYSIQQANIKGAQLDKDDILTEEEKKNIRNCTEKLRQLGVYIGLYAEGLHLPKHPDGIHGYITDAYEATKLVMDGKELPQDLLDRLAYYKPIIDEQLKDR